MATKKLTEELLKKMATKKLTEEQKTELKNLLLDFKENHIKVKFRLIVETLIFCGYDCNNFIFTHSENVKNFEGECLELTVLHNRFDEIFETYTIEKIQQQL